VPGRHRPQSGGVTPRPRQQHLRGRRDARGQVEDRIPARHRAAHRLGVEQVEVEGSCAGGADLVGARAGDRDDVVAGGGEQGQDTAPEHARGTGDEDLHGVDHP
jgi:hypothetical protein